MSGITFDNLTLGYSSHPAVHHVSASLASGSLTALVGPNGAGKATLLKGIVGELRPRTGTITAPPRETIAYLPQLSEIDRGFPISVFETVAMGLWHRVGALGKLGPADRAAVSGAIETVGLAGFERRPIAALSGGQMQRVLFARLMLQDAALILLDEPFSAVDRRTVDDLLGVIARWHQEGRTVVAVLHDLDLAREYFTDALLLAREVVAHGPARAALSNDALRRARAVSEAFDADAQACMRAA